MEVVKQVTRMEISRTVNSYSLIDGKGFHLHLCGIDKELEIWDTFSDQCLAIKPDRIPDLIAALTKINDAYIQGEKDDQD